MKAVGLPEIRGVFHPDIIGDGKVASPALNSFGKDIGRDSRFSNLFLRTSFLLATRKERNRTPMRRGTRTHSTSASEMVAFVSLVGLIIGTPLLAATEGCETVFEIAGKGIAEPRPGIEATQGVAESGGIKSKCGGK